MNHPHTLRCPNCSKQSADHSEAEASACQIAQFEDETGLTFDPNGPAVEECPYCAGLVQFIPNHDCFGTRGENHDAARLDDCGWD